MVVRIVLILIPLLQVAVQQSVDQTLEREAFGAEVVRGVINKLQPVFGDDHQFLRRVAFAESKDGSDSDTYRPDYYGGIWQVDEEKFIETQNITSYPELNATYQLILAEFGIDWLSVEWSNLIIPLYSGIAFRLFTITIKINKLTNVTGQAAYWIL